MTAAPADVFDALGEPVRRAILELLVEGEQAAGAVVARTRRHTPISQPAVSQHLRVLREAGLVTVRAEGTRRLYTLDTEGLGAARDWLTHLLDPMAQFAQPLDALETELVRGRRARRTSGEENSGEGVEKRPGRSA